MNKLKSLGDMVNASVKDIIPDATASVNMFGLPADNISVLITLSLPIDRFEMDLIKGDEIAEWLDEQIKDGLRAAIKAKIFTGGGTKDADN